MNPFEYRRAEEADAALEAISGAGSAKFLVGDFAGAVLDFILIALVVFFIGKALLKPAPTPETKTCPACLEVIAKAATRCKHCTSAV